MIDLAAARETFESSTDYTVGIEEEFALLDPGTNLLAPRFELLRDAAQSDPVLAESIAGELISSEIEIRSGRGEDVADARARQGDRRRRLFTLAGAHGVGLSAVAVGFIVSFIVAIIVVKAFVHYISRHGFSPFGWYRIVLGILILAFFK